MSDDKLQDQIAAGRQATDFLASQTFQGAVASVRTSLMSTWRISKDRDDRDRIWHLVSLLDHLVGALQSAANSGRLAQYELDQLLKERS